MLRKSITIFVAVILLGLTLGPLDIAKAQSSELVCPPFNSTQLHDDLFLQSLSVECLKSYQKLMQVQGVENTTGDVTTLSTGGPDTFGYTFDDTIPYVWIDTSTPPGIDTGLTGDDKASLSPIDIGFSFPFYGLSYSQLYFNTNGGITFGSSSTAFSSFSIPLPSTPNNLIAPFWGDLVVHNLKDGSVVNSGAIYTSQGGTTPNRFFVLEWLDVTTYADTSSPFSFETILYENGDIVVQYQSLPASYDTTVGIENSLGDEGLQYQKGSSGLSAPLAIRYFYPGGIARVQVSPRYAGQFSVVGETSQFELTVANTGSLGTDTYDLTVVSPWSVTLYAADGTTPLTDTEIDAAADGIIDTGPIPQGGSVIIIAKIDTPVSAVVGNANTATITATSSKDTGKSKTSTLQNAVPAPFAQIYRDDADGAMSLELVYPDAQTVKKATLDGYYGFGNEMSVALAPNGNYVYVWSKQYCLNLACTADVYEIEYAILDHFGNTVQGKTKLTDNSGAIIRTYDRIPSVVVAPNGIIGIVWQSHLIESITSSNYNIYFATLDGLGNLVAGPTNITNNSEWNASTSYLSPAITSSDDNSFTMAWEEDSAVGTNLWYATRDSSGANIFSPAALTSDHKSTHPVLNSLKGGKAILTWVGDGFATYAILNSDGTLSKTATTLGTSHSLSEPPYTPYTDAILMPNGKIAVAWTKDKGVEFAILKSDYTLESGPVSASNPFTLQGKGLSVTTNSSNDVIMTWSDVTTSQNLFYALGSSTGTFVTQPMLYMSSAGKIYTSYNGQGNAPLKLPPSVVSITRANPNPTLASSVDFIVTFSDPVTGVDTTDFSLTTNGVSSATVGEVNAVSDSVYTVTVNTGEGNGVIRLDMIDDDTISDSVGNLLGGPGAGNGNYPSGETYTVDKIAPTVLSVTRANGNPTFASSVDFTVIFSDSVTNVDAGDFAFTTNGVSNVTVNGVAAVSGSVYTVTVNTGDGTGTIRLDVVIDDADTIRDTAGNLLGGSYIDGEIYTVDKVVPTIGTFTAVTLSKSFSIPITAFTASDNVGVTGYLITTSATPPAVDAVGWAGAAPTVFTAPTIGSSTLYPWVRDAAGNVSTIYAPVGVVVDLPIVLSITRITPNPTKAASVKFIVTFSKPVTGVDKADFALDTTGIAKSKISGLSGKGAIYTLTVITGAGSGTLRVNVNDNDSIKDASATQLGGAGVGNGVFTSGGIYTIDKTKPTVLSIVLADADYTNAPSVNFIVTFSEPVTGVDIKDFKLVNTGGISKPKVVSVGGAGTTYTVTVNTGIGVKPGTIRLDLNNNKSIKDSVLNPLAATFKTGQIFHKAI